MPIASNESPAGNESPRANERLTPEESTEQVREQGFRLGPPAQAPYAPPRIDEPAPHFEARSTHGLINLNDYRGKWLVFFSHPADFTPVCTSEFIVFAKRSAEFKAANCSLLGLSVDSVYSHLAWRQSIKERFGITIDFPILDDVSMNVARRYGMVHTADDQTSIVRALFVIDDRGMLRAMLWYPITTGRSVDEVLRLVQALQTADRLQVVTPEGWKPGDRTIERPPDTVSAADALKDNAFVVDWYYREHEGQ